MAEAAQPPPHDDDDDGCKYRYRISLRLWHPSIDPADITHALGLQPKWLWRAGTPRRTPTGTPLRGVYPSSYWTREITSGEWPPHDLAGATHDVLEQLVRHRTLFHRIRAEGGSSELFIGWFFNGQSGGLFGNKTLALAGDLQIDVSLDVYPPSQPQHEDAIADDVLPP